MLVVVKLDFATECKLYFFNFKIYSVRLKSATSDIALQRHRNIRPFFVIFRTFNFSKYSSQIFSCKCYDIKETYLGQNFNRSLVK